MNMVRKFPRKWAIPHLSVGLTIVILVFIATIASLFISTSQYSAMDIQNRLQGPNIKHFFGTDQYGRDTFNRVLVASKYSLVVGFVAVGIGVLMGVPIGCVAASRGKWLDPFLSRVMDVVYGFPPVITAVLITAILGPSLINVIIAIGLFNIPIFARLSRGNYLAVQEKEFIEAARASGSSGLTIAFRHIFPNISSPIVIQASTQFAFAILAEAALSYLGLGIQPPNPSWGLMLSQAQSFVRLSPWPVIFPGLSIVLTVLGFNLTGDGLRDLFDPTTRNY